VANPSAAANIEVIMFILRHWLQLLLLIAAGVLPAEPPARGQLPTPTLIAFNEVLADAPGPEADGGGEWVEIRNDGNLTVDLTGWSIGDERDSSDRLLAWEPGGSLLLRPRALALIMDPDGEPAGLDLPHGVLLLRPDDASIGNGLKSDGESLRLVDKHGALVDTVRWPYGAGDGISWERVRGPTEPAGSWRPCRAPGGSTPGRINSWTPVAGDRSVSWRNNSAESYTVAQPHHLVAVLRDEGGAGLPQTFLRADALSPYGEVEELPSRMTPWVAPGDSAQVCWSWRPDSGGGWILVVEVEGPPAPRGWDDRDTLCVQVRHAELSRILYEAQPRPVKGSVEWLEFWSPPEGSEPGSRQPVDWHGWRVRVRSMASPLSAGRMLLLEQVAGPVLLLAVGDSVRAPTAGRPPPGSHANVIWRGLRLADGGSMITLVDPYGAVIDSSVLRPVPGLPRGHSWQRWDPSLPGWSPQAWGLSRSVEDVSPGWVEMAGAAGPADTDRSGTDGGRFKLNVEHTGRGTIRLRWNGPAARLWLEARLYDMSGRLIGTLLPRVLVPGCGDHEWHPTEGNSVVRPGIYLLVVRADDADAEGRWTVRRPLGVRP